MSLKVTIANGPDDRLTIDDCSFGIKGNISLRVYSGIRSYLLVAK